MKKSEVGLGGAHEACDFLETFNWNFYRDTVLLILQKKFECLKPPFPIPEPPDYKPLPFAQISTNTMSWSDFGQSSARSK